MNLESHRPSRRRSRPLAPIAVAAGAVVLIVSPRVASAACHPPPGEIDAPGTHTHEVLDDCRWAHRVGLELTAQVGMGMGFDPGADTFELTSDAQGSRLAPGLGLNLALGWRPTPAFSLGGHLYYQYTPARGLRETPIDRDGLTFTVTGGHTDMVTAGIYARLYIGALAHVRRIDPWIGVGFDWPAVGWVGTNIQVALPGSPFKGTLQQTVSAVALPISAGFDVNVSPELSLGVTGTVSLWFPYSQCGNASAYSASNTATQVVCDADLMADGRNLMPNYSITPMLFVAGEARFLAPW
jgi:hypothetical protein